MRHALSILLTGAVLLAVAAPGASAQSSPFAPPAPLVPPEQQAPEPANVSDPDEEGLKGWQETLIFLGGAALLFGIGFLIVADAKRRRPVTEEELHPGKALAGDPARRRAEQQRRKNRQRIERQARKKNRPKRK